MNDGNRSFSGSIPALYDRHLASLFFEPYANDLAARLDGLTSGDLLELAAGTGVLSRALARALPPAVSLVCTDLSQSMLSYAAARSDSRILWRHADAQQLPFPDNLFDSAVCQFGVMFFPDKAAAYREVRRVLKPGARFLFSVWDRLEENELSLVVDAAMAEFFPHDPPQFVARDPFGYFDTIRIEHDLRAAGFSSIDRQTVVQRGRAPSSLDVAIGLCQGTPLRNAIEARGPHLLSQVTDAVSTAVASRFGSGAIDTRMQAHVFTVSR
ncbi:MAG TPA: methyltransferase domain-containing protein [Candidatus Acidoferrum sp.]